MGLLLHVSVRYVEQTNEGEAASVYPQQATSNNGADGGEAESRGGGRNLGEGQVKEVDGGSRCVDG